MTQHQPLIDRLTEQLGGNRDMALSILRDRGLGPAGRAIDRATKISGRLARDYEYDPQTNRATLKRTK